MPGKERSFLNAASIFVATAAIAILGWHTGLSLSEAIRAASFLALSILPIGYRLLDGCVLAPGERLTLAGLVGLPFLAAAYYLASLLGVASLFPLVILAAAVDAGLRLARRGGLRECLQGFSIDGPALALLGIILVAALFDRGPFVAEPPGLGYRYVHRDDLIQQSFLWEMLRGVPPRETPTAAGIPFTPYHILPYMSGILLSRYARIPVPTVHHLVVPALHLALFCGAAYLGASTLTLSPTLAGASLVGLFFVSNGFLRFRGHYWPAALNVFQVAETNSGILVAVATVLVLLVLYDRARDLGEPSRRFLLLSAAVAGLTYFFKAQVFLFFGPAYVLTLLVWSVLRRSRELIVAAGLATTVAILLFVSWRAPTHYGALSFLPGRLAAEMGIASTFAWVPFGLGALPASAVAWWQSLDYPVALPLCLLWRFARPRRMALAEGVLSLALAGAFVMVSGVLVSEYQGVAGTLAAREATYVFWPLVKLADLVTFGALLQSSMRHGARVMLVGALGLAAWFSFYLVPIETAVLHLSPGEVGALSYLRNETPFDSVVIHARGEALEGAFNRYPVVSGLAGRRCVLEYLRSGIDPDHNRRQDIRRLFLTTNPAVGRQILDRYEVDYVLEYAPKRLQFSSPQLRRVYETSDVSIYQYLGG
jgi:hypothetical protein